MASHKRRIYKRLLALGLLSVCLVVFSFSPKFGSAYATAPCVQECEEFQAMCQDGCKSSCSDTDPNCNNCVSDCDTQFWNCMGSAIWCSSYDYSYTPDCTTDYANHCPVAQGSPNPDCVGGHAGYYQICHNVGGGQCVSCPDHPNEYCQGSGGIPPCF